MDDDDPVAGEVDVDLETIRAKLEAVVERCDGVFGPEGRAAAMRVNERALARRMS
jgi:hypothetical protein